MGDPHCLNTSRNYQQGSLLNYCNKLKCIIILSGWRLVTCMLGLPVVMLEFDSILKIVLPCIM